MNDLFDLTGRNYMVTGGTRGIGRAISLCLARAGAHVTATFVRNQEAATALEEKAVCDALSIQTCRADLTTSKGQDFLTETVQALEGGLHGLVHSAATGVHKPVEELTLRHLDFTFALNVRGFFDLITRLLPLFSDRASVVVLSSQGAVRAVPQYTAIGSSKGALEAMARHLAVELAPRGVRVNILAPGAIATEAWDAMPDSKARLADIANRTPIGRLATAEEVAQAALFLCSDASSGVVGHRLVIDGGADLPV